MQKKFIVCLALACLAVLPALEARSLENGENELMEMAIQALEHGRALTAEESMVMQSGTYGAGDMAGAYGGSAGGILDSDTTTTQPSAPALESGASNAAPAPTTSTTSTAAKPAAAPSTTAKSSALSAHQSAGLLAAGVMAAVFLL